MSTPTREELIKLREVDGMTRDDIAEYYGVTITKVRKWIKDFDVPRPSRQTAPVVKKKVSRRGGLIAPVDDGFTVMERAADILKDRLTEKRGYGYMLDGKPASTQQVVHAAGLKFNDE